MGKIKYPSGRFTMGSLSCLFGCSLVKGNTTFSPLLKETPINKYARVPEYRLVVLEVGCDVVSSTKEVNNFTKA